MIDINIHDTYFVIPYKHIFILAALLFGIIGFGYWLVNYINGKLVKWLTLVHLLVTLGGFLLMWTLNFYFGESNLPTSDFTYTRVFAFNTILAMLGLIVMAIQIVYPINLLIAIIKRKKLAGNKG
jgi:heme/copper-type cytochrome/quinol oxidase subunit 1